MPSFGIVTELYQMLGPVTALISSRLSRSFTVEMWHASFESTKLHPATVSLQTEPGSLTKMIDLEGLDSLS